MNGNLIVEGVPGGGRLRVKVVREELIFPEDRFPGCKGSWEEVPLLASDFHFAGEGLWAYSKLNDSTPEDDDAE